MTRHKHADMLIAKTENMDLVVLCKDKRNYEGDRCGDYESCYFPSFEDDYDYFLCLPRHKEACLNALNGGKSEFTGEVGWTEGFCKAAWNTDAWYMDENVESRIKPHKEKRWIGVSLSSCHSTGHYETRQEAVDITENQPWASAYSPWQFIEIEVEV